MGIENRRHTRVDLDFPVMIRTEKEAIDGRIENLGPEGTFIRLADPHSLPQFVEVEMAIENCLLPIQIRCEVKWRKGGDNSGVGVWFAAIPSFEKAAIGDFIYRVIVEQREWLAQNE